MLIAIEMADYILNRMSNPSYPSTAEQANIRMAEAMAEYIQANAEITFSWIAYSGGGSQDPTTSCTGRYITLMFTLTPSGAIDRTTALNAHKTQLINGMMNATYNITQSGFVTSVGIMSTAPTIGNLNLNPTGNTPMLAMESYCQNIIDWIKQLRPTALCAGTHGAYTGTGTVIAII
jgi:hypothetical protein